MQLTGELLEAIAEGNAPETVRIFRPGPTLAFGRTDRIRAGFGEAGRVAQTHGLTPVVRLGGGHAAAYDSECVIVEILRRHEHRAISGLEARFLDLTEIIGNALASLGVKLELGELPGEYCPGRYSLHLRGGPKVAGVAQRILTRASLTTAVVVAGGGDRLRAALADAYSALDLPLDIRTVGAVTDQHPEINCELVHRTITHHAAARYRIVLHEAGESTGSGID
jgi:lipoate-protein ligase A